MIDWSELSAKPNAIHLLKENPTRINKRKLNQNENANYLLDNLVEKNPQELDWKRLYQHDSM